MTQELFNQSIISIDDLSDTQINRILNLAKQYKDKAPGKILNDKIIATCFFEPSTRTRLSFEAAAIRLGAQIIGFSDASTSSTKKGESLHDAMKMMDSYADAIVLRHPLEGSARMVSEENSVPVINAGDGSNQHPTQALLDLFTIKECHPDKDCLNIIFMGDLKNGRTVHSLAQACRLLNCRLFFVADNELMIPSDVTDILKRDAVRFSFHRNLSEVIDRADILYMTRLQRERSDKVYKKTPYGIGLADLENAKEDLRILHPLPRVDEIATEIDNTPHAYYFQQAENGLYVRQAILSLLLNPQVGD